MSCPTGVEVEACWVEVTQVEETILSIVELLDGFILEDGALVEGWMLDEVLALEEGLALEVLGNALTVLGLQLRSTSQHPKS